MSDVAVSLSWICSVLVQWEGARALATWCRAGTLLTLQRLHMALGLFSYCYSCWVLWTVFTGLLEIPPPDAGFVWTPLISGPETGRLRWSGEDGLTFGCVRSTRRTVAQDVSDLVITWQADFVAVVG